MDEMVLGGIDRRRFLAVCSAAGLGQTLLPGVLFGIVAQAQSAPSMHGAGVAQQSLAKITPEMIDGAAAIAGLTLTAEQKTMMLDGLRQQRDSVMVIRSMKLTSDVAPAVVFDPLPAGMKLETAKHPMRMSAAPDVQRLVSSHNEEDLAFASVRELAELLRTRKVSSLELTKLYLARLKRYDPQLHFVINFTEDRALVSAAAADKEIATGHYRGPLHGVPWGVKDMFAVKGYPTTWGAGGYEKQQFDYDATVVQRLDAAGAVLLAKLSMGELASGPSWFGGMTRTPWNPKQPSGGSSAGSGSAVGGGCVGFAIGTEALGSITYPSSRCGATGLRPTFGFVPRTGAMTQSWTMDKVGAITRSAEDCALVISAIYGPDGHDRSVKDASFNWDAEFDWKKLRVGYLKSEFDAPTLNSNASAEDRREFAREAYDAKYLARSLDTLKKMGVNLISVTLPKGYHFGDQAHVLGVEAAAAFEELTLSGRDSLLSAQGAGDWGNSFRVDRFYSAVDYIQAQRARMLAIEAMAKVFADVDVLVTPIEGAQLTATNLTGHPAVIVPNGVRGDDAPLPEHTGDGDPSHIGGPGTPVAITFLGGLYSDARLLAFARAYQEAAGFRRLRPRMQG